MATILARNWINVRPGDPAFIVSTNVCDWFELGQRAGQDYWLEGVILRPTEFVFNGRLFLPDASEHGTIIDNFPKGPTPTGWIKRQRADGAGYELVSIAGKSIFGFLIEGPLCKVTANIYAANGALVAESLVDQFLLHRGPASIGRGGITFT